MRAVVYDQHGSPDVLELRELDEPVAREDQVVVRGACGLAQPYRLAPDARSALSRARLVFGLRKPGKATVLADDFAGVVASVGERVAVPAR